MKGELLAGAGDIELSICLAEGYVIVLMFVFCVPACCMSVKNDWRRKGEIKMTTFKIDKYLFEIITLFLIILLFPSNINGCLFQMLYIYSNFSLFVAHSVVLMLSVARACMVVYTQRRNLNFVCALNLHN